MTEYRWRCGKSAGPWLETRREALENAVRCGHGSEDPHSHKIYLTVPAEIEERADV